jgi:polyhydroxybutyrate depolymerase
MVIRATVARQAARTPFSAHPGWLAVALAFLIAGAGCRRNPNPLPTAAAPSPSVAVECAAGDRWGEINSGGGVRRYRMYIPAAYSPDRPAALLLGFHGNGGAADGFEEYSGIPALADQAGFIAVFPQGAGEIPTWEINPVTDNADVQFIRDLIADLSARCAIDPARIYATGHSRGGGMANRLACDLADQIAAIGPVSGAYPPEGGCFPARPVAVIAFHGSADPVIPYNGIGNQSGPPAAYFTFGIPIPQWASAWAARNGCTSEKVAILDEVYLFGEEWSNCSEDADVILYTIPDGGHGWPDGTTFTPARMMWEFFEKHARRR